MVTLGRAALVPAAALTFLLASVPILTLVVLGAPILAPKAGLALNAGGPLGFPALWGSVRMALVGASAGWAAGTLAALGIWSRAAPVRRLVLGAAWLVLLVPQGFAAQGIVRMAQATGLTMAAQTGAAHAASILAQAAPAAGLVLLIMTAALNRLDPQILRSAAASGATPPQAWLHAVMPALAWALTMAAAAAFALCLSRWQLDAPLSSHRPALGGMLGQAARQHDAAAAQQALLMAGLTLAPLLPLGLLAVLVRRLA